MQHKVIYFNYQLLYLYVLIIIIFIELYHHDYDKLQNKFIINLIIRLEYQVYVSNFYITIFLI
jgi:hypothetical protein